jgi:energy-coupling factor transporter ATP-binding protein EcfA2
MKREQEQDCPYPGLRPFEEEDIRFFFGRDQQIQDLATKLNSKTFIAVVGLSGCGKSSLVKAGLIPLLKADYGPMKGAPWRIITMNPGNDPLGSLADGLLKTFADKFRNTERGKLRRDLQCTIEGGLAEVLDGSGLIDSPNVLLFVDQFEELFTHDNGNDRNEEHIHARSDRADFVALLLDTVKQTRRNVYVLITMRSEYLGHCNTFVGLSEAFDAGMYIVPRLASSQRESAIIEPARLMGVTIEPKLVKKIMRDMESDPDQLPLMQNSLRRMYEAEVQKRDSNLELKDEDYESIKSALNSFAERIYSGYGVHGSKTAGWSEKQKEATELIFRCICVRDATGKAIRRATTISEIMQLTCLREDEIREVVDVFRDEGCNFVTPFKGDLKSDTSINISHESLIRQWDRLKRWVDEEAKLVGAYERIYRAAFNWDRAAQEHNKDLKSDTSTNVYRESLIPQWDRLKRWLVHAYERIYRGAFDWEGAAREHNEERWLLRGIELDAAIKWRIDRRINVNGVTRAEKATDKWCERYRLKEVPEGLSAEDKRRWDSFTRIANDAKKLVYAFVEISELNETNQLEHERKLKRWATRTAGICLTLTIGLACVAWFWRSATQEAQRATQEAQQERMIAMASAFMSQAELHELQLQDRQAAMLMALEAFRHLVQLSNSPRDTSTVCLKVSQLLTASGIIPTETTYDWYCNTSEVDGKPPKERLYETEKLICNTVNFNLSLSQWGLATNKDYRTFRISCPQHLDGLTIEVIEAINHDTPNELIEKRFDDYVKNGLRVGEMDQFKESSLKAALEKTLKRARTGIRTWKESGQPQLARLKAEDPLIVKFMENRWPKTLFEDDYRKQAILPQNDGEKTDPYVQLLSTISKVAVSEKVSMERVYKEIPEKDWAKFGGVSSVARALNSVCQCGSAFDKAKEVFPLCDGAVKLSRQGETSPYSFQRGLAKALQGDLTGARDDYQRHLTWIKIEQEKTSEQQQTTNLRSETIRVQLAIEELKNTSQGGKLRLRSEIKEQMKQACDLSVWQPKEPKRKE